MLNCESRRLCSNQAWPHIRESVLSNVHVATSVTGSMVRLPAEPSASAMNTHSINTTISTVTVAIGTVKSAGMADSVLCVG
ncbi:hypothetical protein SARC_18207, partial [Sphaeroforma arctica JP610]